MVDKINVEIPLDLARKFVSWQRDGSTAELEELVKAALPREYPDGTYAWVTAKGSPSRRLVFRENGCWVTREDGPTYVYDYEVAKVEVLPVAGAGEMVVPRPPDGIGMHEAINYLRKHGYFATPLWLESALKAAKDA